MQPMVDNSSELASTHTSVVLAYSKRHISQMKASLWPIFSLALKKLNKLFMSGVCFFIERSGADECHSDPGGSLLERPGKLTKKINEACSTTVHSLRSCRLCDGKTISILATKGTRNYTQDSRSRIRSPYRIANWSSLTRT